MDAAPPRPGVAWVVLDGGVPTTLITKAFNQLPGFRAVSRAGMLWSHAVEAHAHATRALKHMLTATPAGDVCNAFRKHGYRTVICGARPECSVLAEESMAPPESRTAPLTDEVHDCVTAYQALDIVLNTRNDKRPLFLVIVLRGCSEICDSACVARVQRAFASNEEACMLAATVHSDVPLMTGSNSNRIPALIAQAKCDREKLGHIAGTPGELAARLHATGWIALTRASNIMTTLQRAMEVCGASMTMAVCATHGLAMGEHGAFGTGAPWCASTRTFFAVTTNSQPFLEEHPVSIDLAPVVLLDLQGIPQGTRAVAPAWSPKDFGSITVQRDATLLSRAHLAGEAEAVHAPFFVKATFANQGRFFSWTVWFPWSVNCALRVSLSNMSCDELLPGVMMQAYDLSSDPDEQEDLRGDPYWCSTPLCRTLWQQARSLMLNSCGDMLKDAPPRVLNNRVRDQSPPLPVDLPIATTGVGAGTGALIHTNDQQHTAHDEASREHKANTLQVQKAEPDLSAHVHEQVAVSDAAQSTRACEDMNMSQQMPALPLKPDNPVHIVPPTHQNITALHESQTTRRLGPDERATGVAAELNAQWSRAGIPPSMYSDESVSARTTQSTSDVSSRVVTAKQESVVSVKHLERQKSFSRRHRGAHSARQIQSGGMERQDTSSSRG